MKNEDKAYTGTQNWKDYKKALENKPKVQVVANDLYLYGSTKVNEKELTELIVLSKENAVITKDEEIMYINYVSASKRMFIDTKNYDITINDEFDTIMALRDAVHNFLLSGEKVIEETGIFNRLGLMPYINKDKDGEVRAYADNTDSDDMVGLMSALFNGNPQMATMMVDKMYESIPSSMIDPNKSKLDNLKDYMEMTK